jgi:hypothetical protein
VTVEHDGYEGFDGDGPDPLMAVITGEPLPDAARADAAFMAAHRSAEADVALLREQLGLLGQALAGPAPEPAAKPVPEPAPKPVPVPVRRRRPFVFGVRAVGVACAVGTVSLLGWLAVQSGGAMSDAGGSAAADQKSHGDVLPHQSDGSAQRDAGSQSAPGYVACARLIVEGDVTAVEPVPGADQDRITLRVTRYLKPDKGKAEVTFVMDHDVDPRLRLGDHALIGIPEGSAAPDIWSVGPADVARSRAWITEALPRSRSIACW